MTTANTPTSGAADLPEPHFGEGRHLGLAFRADAYSVAQVQALFASRGQSPSPQAAQQPAPSPAPADTVVLEAALRAIHQAIDLIGEPDTDRLRTVRRVLRGAVIVAEDDGKVAPLPSTAYAALPAPNYPKSGGFPGTFAEAQMHAFADATHTLRASHGQAPAQPDNSAVHLSHCNMGEHVGSCKYGDDDCPALRKAPAQAIPAAVAGCTRSHPHENMDSACRAKAAIAEMQNRAARGAEATAHDLERFVAMLAAAPTTQPAPVHQVNYSVLYMYAERKRVDYNDLCATVHEAIARAASAPADSVLEDAARYRYLRDGDWREHEKLESVIRLQLNALWDETIDAARKQGEKQ